MSNHMTEMYREAEALAEGRHTYGPNFNGVVMAVPERWSCEPMLAATREDALSEIAESNEAATDDVFNAPSEGDDE